MLVREVMSSPAVTVSEDTSVRAALRLLDDYGITAMPVVDGDGGIVGVVSEADLVRETVLPDVRAHMLPVQVVQCAPARSVAGVMTRTPVTVSSGTDLAEAVGLLTSTVVKSLPVVDGGRVVGVVSRKDVVHVLARQDDAIWREVDELLRSECTNWFVDVTDGVARVWGPVGEHERRIAEVLAGSVAGVLAVQVV